MNEIHGYCGYRCDLCPAFVSNQKGFEDRQRISDGWQKYLGFRLEPEKIVCAGCRFEGCHLDGDCKVRPCAMAKSCMTCAECVEFDSCDQLREKSKPLHPSRSATAVPCLPKIIGCTSLPMNPGFISRSSGGVVTNNRPPKTLSWRQWMTIADIFSTASMHMSSASLEPQQGGTGR